MTDSHNPNNPNPNNPGRDAASNDFSGDAPGPDHGGPEDPVGSGVSLDELADLHAGVLTDRESKALRARIADDPAAAEMLAALDRTVAVLGELPEEPIPDDVVARIDAALRAEAAAAAPTQTRGSGQDLSDDAEVLDLAAARNTTRTARGSTARGGGRPRRWVGPVLALGVAAAIAVGVVGGVLSSVRGPDPQAGSAPIAPNLTAAELATLWPGIRGARDLSFLDVPGKLEKCVLTADPTAEVSNVLGARPVVVDGQYGVAVAVRSSIDAVPDNDVLLVVLGPGCASDADVIAQTYVPE